ncbi:MAG: glycosyltransferase [Planctomycetes bacterium]|nr:glycosyltransferase [Planctomycetota bacterium]
MAVRIDEQGAVAGPAALPATTHPCEVRRAVSGPLVSLIVPAYREELRIERSLAKLARFAAGARWPIEVLVVDDGSPDETARAAARLQEQFRSLRVLRHAHNLGKGAAVRTGFRAAAGEIVVFSDADLSTPLTELPCLIAALERGADIAIASRYVPRAAIRVAQPLARRVAGRVFRALAAGLVPLGLADTQCGFKAFTRRAARLVARASRIDGFAFDVEWLALARKADLAIAEVPVEWSDDPRSTLALGAASRTMLVDLWRVRRRIARLRQRISARPGARSAA